MQTRTNQLVDKRLQSSLDLRRISRSYDIEVQVTCNRVRNINIGNGVSPVLLTISYMTIADHVLDSVFTQVTLLPQMVLGFVDYLLELVKRDGNVVLVCLALFRDCLRKTFPDGPERGEMGR